MRIEMMRLHIEGSLKGCDRLIRVALLMQYDAQCVLGLRIIRLERDGPAQRFGCFIQLALLLKCQSEVAMRQSKIGIYRQCSPIGRNGLVHLMQRLINNTQVAMNLGAVGSECKSPKENLSCLSGLTCFMEHQAQGGERRKVIWILGKNLAADRLSA